MRTVHLAHVLRARIAEVRQSWLEVERLADDLVDDKLDLEVYSTRIGILGTADRVDQLILDDLSADLTPIKEAT